ncbi:MAG: cation diffusion facilitator family transporter [Deferribacteraceae bacterium]|jgi:cation diffusion facilitator family transporter|nr:cation diffusion facilitator family transporter [Deferribacteraceae bacterium]
MGTDENSAAKEKKNAAFLSLLAAIFLTAAKLAAGIYTNSLGILSEALHSALDLLAALVTMFAVYISLIPADKKHTYGHGKIENISALAESMLLLITCAWIFYEALGRLTGKDAPVKMSVWALVVMGLSIVIDISRTRNLMKVAKKHNSQALEADALHFSSDILSSSVVIIGLISIWLANYAPERFFIKTVLLNADSFAALIVAVIVVFMSIKLSTKAVSALMDSIRPEDLAMLEKSVMNTLGVVRISRLRLRQSGDESFIDMKIVIPFDYSLQEAHNVTKDVEEKICAILPKADVTVHYEPEGQADDNV